MKAYRSIDHRLACDNAIGRLMSPARDNLIEFPGRSRPASQTYGPITKQETIAGIPIMIGGKIDPLPVHLEEGEAIHLCDSSRAVARQLAKHLIAAVVRTTGSARRHRDPDGIWIRDHLGDRGQTTRS